MKAFVIAKKEVIEAKMIDEPVMGPADVLIEVHYIGLCGSDLNAYKGLMPFVKFPRIPGHEISGVIIEKGVNVPETFHIGDKVTVSPYTHCGVCPSCRVGRINTCEFNQTLGVQREGALTERIAVPFEKVFLSPVLTLQELALVEPFSVGYHASNRGSISEIDTVLLFGCGAIGMGALCAAVRKGATVIALDIDDSKLEQAKKLGATHVINSAKTDPGEYIAKLTGNEGVSVAVEAAGNPDTFKLALDLVCFSGRIVTIGYSKKDVEINTQLIVKKELDIFGSRNALRVFPSVINMFEKRERPYTDLITKIFSFSDVPLAFKYWHDNAPKISKILIEVKK